MPLISETSVQWIAEIVEEFHRKERRHVELTRSTRDRSWRTRIPKLFSVECNLRVVESETFPFDNRYANITNLIIFPTSRKGILHSDFTLLQFVLRCPRRDSSLVVNHLQLLWTRGYPASSRQTVHIKAFSTFDVELQIQRNGFPKLKQINALSWGWKFGRRRRCCSATCAGCKADR